MQRYKIYVVATIPDLWIILPLYFQNAKSIVFAHVTLVCYMKSICLILETLYDCLILTKCWWFSVFCCCGHNIIGSHKMIFICTCRLLVFYQHVFHLWPFTSVEYPQSSLWVWPSCFSNQLGLTCLLLITRLYSLCKF